MKAKELEKYVGKTIKEIEYDPGEKEAYLVFTDGFAVAIAVEPTYD